MWGAFTPARSLSAAASRSLSLQGAIAIIRVFGGKGVGPSGTMAVAPSRAFWGISALCLASAAALGVARKRGMLKAAYFRSRICTIAAAPSMSAARKLDLIGTMELAFLGTCSSVPSATRNQQSTALRLGGSIWLFDCGEATQLQLTKARWRSSKISRIFISHLHGDHIFGLPGMMCNIANAAGDAEHELAIFGPRGLRAWLRVTMLHSYAILGSMTYVVHELWGLRAEALQGVDMPRLDEDAIGMLHPNEKAGQNLLPDSGGAWHLPLEPRTPARVVAAELCHSVPTVGFTVIEDERPGTIDAAALVPILDREGLPRSVIGDIKAGRPVQCSSGTVLQPADYMSPPTQRKVVILGDLSAPTDAILHLSAGCNLLVHEATNAYLPPDGVVESEDETRAGQAEVQAAAIEKGHSTPQMAGDFARRVGAATLALNHFSARYSGATDEKSMETMDQIARLAQGVCGVPVVCTRDLMVLTIGLDGKVQVAQEP